MFSQFTIFAKNSVSMTLAANKLPPPTDHPNLVTADPELVTDHPNEAVANYHQAFYFKSLPA